MQKLDKNLTKVKVEKFLLPLCVLSTVTLELCYCQSAARPTSAVLWSLEEGSRMAQGHTDPYIHVPFFGGVTWSTNWTPTLDLAYVFNCRVPESCLLIIFLGIPASQILPSTVGVRRAVLGQTVLRGWWCVPSFQWLLLVMLDSSPAYMAAVYAEHPWPSSHENRCMLQELGQILILLNKSFDTSSPSRIEC